VNNLRSQVVRLYNDLREAVKADPKPPAGAVTRCLLWKLADQAKNEAHHKGVAETVVAVLGRARVMFSP